MTLESCGSHTSSLDSRHCVQESPGIGSGLFKTFANKDHEILEAKFRQTPGLCVLVQSPSHVPFFATSWTTALMASLSFTISLSSLRFMSVESVMLSNHFILCHPLVLLPSIFPSIRVFSSELTLHIRWPMYGRFSINPSYNIELI